MAENVAGKRAERERVANEVNHDPKP